MLTASWCYTELSAFSLLADIKDKEGEWNALGTLKSLVNQEEMKKYVLEKHIVIDRCVEIFQVWF